jgi:hypothetical protein
MEHPSGQPEGPTTEEIGGDVGRMDGEIRHLVRDEPPAAAYVDPVASADVHDLADPLDPGLPSRDTDDPLDPGSHVI